ncbi:MAG: PD-(D/E)XK nuclease family protein, partial [Pseudomonadota bacterium]|nr:PD-(D/E)XK nuclease family protein [Pseudomonadota bacterium]
MTMADSNNIDSSLLIDLASNTDLNDLSSNFLGFNMFESMGMARQEIRHSNALATILNPNSELGVGAFIFRHLMRSVFSDNKDDLPRGLNTIGQLDFEIADYQDLLIKREYKYIDLLMISHSNKHVFVIENKVGASESDQQLVRYQNTINEEFSDYQKLFMFLTPDKEEATEDWLTVSYLEVVDAIEDFLAEHSNITVEPKVFLKHYLDLLKRHVVTDQKLIILANKIYEQNRAALDFIFENKNDEIQVFNDSLTDALKKNELF